jgi:type IV pilus assembly protein PilA
MFSYYFHNNENGYTLLELMVVILILAILFSLAVVTYAGVINNGYDTEAKANLRHAVTAAQAYYTGKQATFTGMNAFELEQIAKGIVFRDGEVNTDNEVYISEVTSTSYILKCRSRSGIIFTATGEHTKADYNF